MSFNIPYKMHFFSRSGIICKIKGLKTKKQNSIGIHNNKDLKPSAPRETHSVMQCCD